MTFSFLVYSLFFLGVKYIAFTQETPPLHWYRTMTSMASKDQFANLTAQRLGAIQVHDAVGGSQKTPGGSRWWLSCMLLVLQHVFFEIKNYWDIIFLQELNVRLMSKLHEISTYIEITCQVQGFKPFWTIPSQSFMLATICNSTSLDPKTMVEGSRCLNHCLMDCLNKLPKTIKTHCYIAPKWENSISCLLFEACFSIFCTVPERGASHVEKPHWEGLAVRL